MQCSRCRAENRQGRRFCAECGASLALACSACGFSNEPGERFCGGCGAPLGSSPTVAEPKFGAPESYTPKHLAEKILTSKNALEGERKQVTVLFADLKGSMELLADGDPEEARKLLDPVLERMMEAVHRYEGTVNQVMGDGIMALFGAPLAHEDHAVRACYAALRMQDAVRRYSDALRRAQGVEAQIRVGLNSGEVVVRSIGSDLRMDYTAVGQTTHLAARMEQLAAPGTVRLTGETLRLAEGYVEVRPLGPIPVKGLPNPIEIFELTGAGQARTRLQAAAVRGLTPFVGRDAEVEHLRRVLGQAGTGHGQVVAIVGEAGVGKSRLTYEFTHSHRVQDWLMLEASSVSYGKATSYLPVIDLLKGYFKIGAVELCQRLGDDSQLLPTLNAVYSFHLQRAEYAEAGDTATRLLALAERRQDPTFEMIGHRAVGAVRFHTGRLADALTSLERALALYDVKEHAALAVRYGTDHAQVTSCFLGLAEWILGDVMHARERLEWAVAHGERLGHVHSIGLALSYLGIFLIAARELDALPHVAERLIALSERASLTVLECSGRLYLAAARRPRTASTLAAMREAADAWWATGTVAYRPFVEAVIAEAYADVGDIDRGLAAIRDALAHLEQSNERWIEPEVHRVHGVLLAAAPGCAAEAEACLAHAADVARAQHARMWEVRATVALARVVAARDRAGARRRLETVVRQFPVDLATSDLAAARTLSASLD